MNKTYDPLFTPWKIGNVEIKNRIVMTSMGGTSIFGWMSPTTSIRKRRGFFWNGPRTTPASYFPV